MNNFKEITLGIEGIEYIRGNTKDKLTLDNGKTLSNYILKNVNLEEGYVTTLIPEEVDIKEALKFEMAIIPILPESEWKYYTMPNGEEVVVKRNEKYERYDTYFYLVANIKKFLLEKEGNICIIEDYMSEVGDPCLSEREARMMTYKKEVYYLLTKEDNINDKIKKILAFASSSVSSIGAMISLQKDILKNFIKKRELILNDFEILSKNVWKIFTSAYDDEGYLIWHKKER